MKQSVKEIFNRNAVAAMHQRKRETYRRRNRVAVAAVADSILPFPRVAETATLGWRP
jgi:hypothetical protein